MNVKKLLALALSLSSVMLVGAALTAAPASAWPSTGAWCPTAPATHICPSKYPVGTAFKAELEPGTTMLFKAGIETQCKEAGVEGTLSENGANENIILPSSVKFGACSSTVETIKNGDWRFPWTEGSHSGLEGYGSTYIKITNNSLGVSCVYQLFGSAPQKGVELIGGSPAHILISTGNIRKVEGSFFCATAGTMSARFNVVSPSPLYVEKQ
jgi:hypothetical protein